MSAYGCSKSHKHETDLHWYKLSQEVAPMCAPRQQNAKQNDSDQSKEPKEVDRKFIMKAGGGTPHSWRQFKANSPSQKSINTTLRYIPDSWQHKNILLIPAF